MDRTEKQKLNEKLAKWAGFHQVTRKEVYDLGHYTTWENNRGYFESRLPNFTDSLDTCRKWLIPKLDKCSISTNKALSINVDCPDRFTIEVMIDKSYRTKGGFLVRNELWSRIREDSPSLALCLAIENLIDKEEEEE